MRTILALSALWLLVPSMAVAQVPAPTGCTIECPGDSLHPGVQLNFPADMSQCYVDPAVVQCSCYDRCGGDSEGGAGDTGGAASSGGGGGQQQTAGVPPIVSAVVGLAALVVAPVFTMEFKRDPAEILAEVNRAKELWSAHRDEIRNIEQEGTREETRYRQEREWSARFNRELAVKARAPSVPSSYHWIPEAAPKHTKDSRRWGDGGYCSEVVRAADQVLIDADAEATKQSLTFLPTTAGVLGKAKKVAEGELLRSAGLARLAEQRADFGIMYDESAKYYAFMAALMSCTVRDLESANTCINALLAAEMPTALKSAVKRLLGDGLADTLKRVREFAVFYQRFVRRLQIQNEKLTIAALRCN